MTPHDVELACLFTAFVLAVFALVAELLGNFFKEKFGGNA